MNLKEMKKIGYKKRREIRWKYGHRIGYAIENDVFTTGFLRKPSNNNDIVTHTFNPWISYSLKSDKISGENFFDDDYDGSLKPKRIRIKGEVKFVQNFMAYKNEIDKILNKMKKKEMKNLEEYLEKAEYFDLSINELEKQDKLN